MMGIVTSISESPSPLTFTGLAPTPQIVGITNTGNSGNEAWSVTNSSAWLSASPTSDAALPQGNTDNVTVSVNTSGLNPGTYNDTLVFTCTGGNTVNVPVTLTVPFIPTPYVEPNAGPIPGAVVGPSIDNSPFPLPRHSRMPPVIGRVNGGFLGGLGRYGASPFKKKGWWPF